MESRLLRRVPQRGGAPRAPRARQRQRLPGVQRLMVGGLRAGQPRLDEPRLCALLVQLALRATALAGDLSRNLSKDFFPADVEQPSALNYVPRQIFK